MPDQGWASGADLAMQEGSLCLGKDCEVGLSQVFGLAPDLFLIPAPPPHIKCLYTCAQTMLLGSWTGGQRAWTLNFSTDTALVCVMRAS